MEEFNKVLQDLKIKTRQALGNKKIVIGLLVVLLVIFNVVFYQVGYNSGINAAQVEIDSKKVDYDELVMLYEDKDKKTKAAEMKLGKVEKSLDENNKKYEEFKEMESNVESTKNAIKENEAKNEALESKHGELSDDIKKSEDELSTLNGNILKSKGKPVELSAGEFVFGQDIDPGRYTATPIGRGSNFVVRDSMGGLEVNQILGSIGVSEYTFTAGSGYSVKTEAPVKLQLVE